jgi:putative ABC transport system permease protein
MLKGEKMIKNFFKTGYRNIKKEKILSFVLIISLVVGLTPLSLIAVYFNFTYSFDSYHTDAEKIYRVITNEIPNDKKHELTVGAYTDIINHCPGINAATKLFRWSGPMDLKTDENKFKVEKVFFTDSGFFKVFTHKFIAGSPVGSLTTPNEAIITKNYALNFWGKTDVVGKEFNCFGLSYYVKGVIEDVPYNSDFRFNMLLPLTSIPGLVAQLKGNEFYTYLRIDKKANDNNVLSIAKMGCLEEYSKKEKVGFPKINLIFQPLLDAHLNSDTFGFKIAEHGNINQIKILFIIFICILIIIVMNFVNLLTVRFQKRLKEVGIRKILGGNNFKLLLQFVSEPVIISLIASALSIVAVHLLSSPFGDFFNLKLAEYYNSFWYIILFILGLGLVVGILSAVFPIYKLIKINNPSEILAEVKSVKRKKTMYIAVVVQFAVVAGLLITVLVTSSQLNYLKTKDLGFNKDQIIIINYNDGVTLASVATELEKIPGIKGVTASQTIPGQIHSGMTLGNLGAPAASDFSVFENRIQKNFIPVFGLKLIAGRDFMGSNEEEVDNIILNETSVKLLRSTPENIINQKVRHLHGPKTVIGVVEDFHFMSLRTKIEPLILSINPRSEINYFSLLINTDNYSLLLKNINSAFKSINSNYEVTYSFLKDDLDKQYLPDEKEASMILFIAFLCITLSLVGLVSLTSYTVIQRSKEIGIRKVFGASTGKIMTILFKDYIKLIILSNIIILPIVESVISKWLNNYAYHVNLSFWYFADAFLISLVLTVITVFYFTLRGSMKNPVTTLKHE